ncbi:hypothetical protein MKY37_20595 [Psychrobacillus sp. FSL K6-2836]
MKKEDFLDLEPAEANIAIREEFYTENDHEEVLPTHVNSNALVF